MPDKHLYEYAVLRVVPRVEREEFINVGVVLFCASQHFVRVAWHVPTHRLKAFLGEIEQVDFEVIERDIRARLRAFERVCVGGAEGGPIGALPPASRFRWLTAARSTVLQTSPVHPGLCTDPAEALARLFEQLVV
jgi:hypothetical protein